MGTSLFKILQKSFKFTIQNSRFWLYGLVFGIWVIVLIFSVIYILPVIISRRSYFLQSFFLNGSAEFLLISIPCIFFCVVLFALGSWLKTILVLELQYWLFKKKIFFDSKVEFTVPSLLGIAENPTWKTFFILGKKFYLKVLVVQAALFFIFYASITSLLLPFVFWLRGVSLLNPIVLLTLLLAFGFAFAGIILRRFSVYFVCLYRAGNLPSINAATELLLLVKQQALTLLLIFGFLYVSSFYLGLRVLSLVLNSGFMSVGVGQTVFLPLVLLVLLSFYAIIFVFTETCLLVFFNNLVRPLEFKLEEQGLGSVNVSDARQ